MKEKTKEFHTIRTLSLILKLYRYVISVADKHMPGDFHVIYNTRTQNLPSFRSQTPDERLVRRKFVC